MSERLHVEVPLLTQLSELGWTVIDQGEGLPTAPTKSLRQSFREVYLKKVFFESVRAINRDEDGAEWLSEADLEGVYELVTGAKGNCGSVRDWNATSTSWLTTRMPTSIGWCVL